MIRTKCISKAVLFVLLSAFLLLPAMTVFAADITVDEDCSLANAILSASDQDQVEPLNSCEAGDEDATAVDTITIDVTGTDEGTIVLTSTLSITTPIAIEGGGFVVSGDDTVQVFNVDGTSLSINSLTVTAGSSESNGGAIAVSDGSLTLTNSVVSASAAVGHGGGIYAVDSELSLSNSAVSGNSISEESETDGGGIYFSSSGTNGLTIAKSGLDGNSSPADGGGLYISGGVALITNTSFGENSAVGSGGGIYSASTATLTHVTVANNTAETGGGLHDAEQLHLYNSLLTGNTGGDCSGTLNSNIGNLIHDGSCGHDELTSDPRILELSGLPIYYVLESGSPAVDAGDNAYCLAEDQRGLTRPEDRCDIGASEYSSGAFSFQIALAQSTTPEEEDSSSSSSSSSTTPSTPPTPTCESLPEGVTVTGYVSGTQCQERDASGIGNQTIIDSGFKKAIDFWGYVPPSGVYICFQDTGNIVLLDATTSPRTIVPLATTTIGNNRCAHIDREGTAVLMPPEYGNAGASGAVAAQDTEVALTGCTVTTTEIVNQRNAPAGDTILYVILNDYTFTALARTSGWFQVDNFGTVGWISADFVTTQGTCG